jgi:hypothetical protein
MPLATIFALRGMLFEKCAETFVRERLDEAAYVTVAELRLGLALELWLRNLDRDDGDETLAHVVALERLVSPCPTSCSPQRSCSPFA